MKYNNNKSLRSNIINYSKRLLSLQEYKCYICNINIFIDIETIKRNPNSKKGHIDHNHRTNNIRGILCNSCNTYIIGAIENRLHRLHLKVWSNKLIYKALDYLNNPPSKIYKEFID